jgi:N12 class adenine-specific DNA methylase
MKLEELQQAGFDDDEIGAFVASKRPNLLKAGFTEDEINDYFGVIDVAVPSELAVSHAPSEISKLPAITPPGIPSPSLPPVEETPPQIPGMSATLKVTRGTKRVGPAEPLPGEKAIPLEVSKAGEGRYTFPGWQKPVAEPLPSPLQVVTPQERSDLEARGKQIDVEAEKIKKAKAELAPYEESYKKSADELDSLGKKLDSLDPGIREQKKLFEDGKSELAKLGDKIDTFPIDRTSRDSVNQYNALIRQFQEKQNALKTHPYLKQADEYNVVLNDFKTKADAIKGHPYVGVRTEFNKKIPDYNQKFNEYEKKRLTYNASLEGLAPGHADISDLLPGHILPGSEEAKQLALAEEAKANAPSLSALPPGATEPKPILQRNLLELLGITPVGQKPVFEGKGLNQKEIVRAQNITAISKVTDLPPSFVEENYDALTKQMGIRGVPTTAEMMQLMIGAAIGQGMITGPISTLFGIGSYMGAKELESLSTQALKGEIPKPLQGRELKEFLGPLDERQNLIVDTMEFAVPGFLGSQVMSKIKGKLSKELAKKFIDDAWDRYVDKQSKNLLEYKQPQVTGGPGPAEPVRPAPVSPGPTPIQPAPAPPPEPVGSTIPAPGITPIAKPEPTPVPQEGLFPTAPVVPIPMPTAAIEPPPAPVMAPVGVPTPVKAEQPIELAQVVPPGMVPEIMEPNAPKPKFKTSEEAQKAIDDLETELEEKYGWDELKNLPIYPELSVGLPATKVSPQEVEQLRGLYQARDKIDQKDLSEWRKVAYENTGLPKEEAKGAFEAIGFGEEMPSAVYFTGKGLKEFGQDSLINLGALYNYFSKNDEERTFAEFKWGGTSDNPTLQGSIVNDDGFPSRKWNEEALKKTEAVYNAIAATQSMEPISLSRIPKGMPEGGPEKKTIAEKAEAPPPTTQKVGILPETKQEGKKPWQMTQGEFLKEHKGIGLASEEMALQPPEERMPSADIDARTGEIFRDHSHPGIMIDEGLQPEYTVTGFMDKEGKFQYQYPKEAHEIFVRTAIEKGEKVPDEVLKDYPELAKEARGGVAPTLPPGISAPREEIPPTPQTFRQFAESKGHKWADVKGELADELKSEFDAVKEPEVTRTETKKPEKAGVNRPLVGEYSNEGESPRDYPGKLSERNFGNDLRRFAKELQKELGYEVDPNINKGKLSGTNVAPVGGDGTILMWKPNSEYGIYIKVRVDRGEDDSLKVQGLGFPMEAIMWRWTTKKDPWTGKTNQWINEDVTPKAFADLIKSQETQVTEPKKPAVPPVEPALPPGMVKAETQPEEVPKVEAVAPPGVTVPQEKPKVSETNERLMRIAEASREPLPEIVPVYSLKGTDGKWHRPAGFPFGVSSTGERRLDGYAIRNSQGATVGTLEQSEQAVKDNFKKAQDKKVSDFYKQLLEMPEERIKSQEEYWLKKSRSAEAKPTPESVFSVNAPIPLIQDILNNPEYQLRAKGRSVTLEWMTPDQYLEMQAREKGVSLDADIRVASNTKVKEYADAMRALVNQGKGKKFPALWIEEGRGNQEGKHRALAAKQAGLDKVPVYRITYTEAPKPTPEPEKKVPTKYKVGDPVVVKWGNNFYPATVKSVQGGGRYSVNPNLTVQQTREAGLADTMQVEEDQMALVGERKEEISKAPTTGNRHLKNPETGKTELYFDKASFDKLPANLKDQIRRRFLWSPRRKGWVSKAVKDNFWPRQIIRDLEKEGVFGKIEAPLTSQEIPEEPGAPKVTPPGIEPAPPKEEVPEAVFLSSTDALTPPGAKPPQTVRGRYMYRSPGEPGWKVMVQETAPINTPRGHDNLVAVWNSRDKGEREWKWVESEKGDFDYPKEEKPSAVTPPGMAPAEEKPEKFVKPDMELSTAIRDRTIEKSKKFLAADQPDETILLTLTRNAKEAMGEVVNEFLETDRPLSERQTDYINSWDADNFAESVLSYAKRHGLTKGKPEPKAEKPADLSTQIQETIDNEAHEGWELGENQPKERVVKNIIHRFVKDPAEVERIFELAKQAKLQNKTLDISTGKSTIKGEGGEPHAGAIGKPSEGKAAAEHDRERLEGEGAENVPGPKKEWTTDELHPGHRPEPSDDVRGLGNKGASSFAPTEDVSGESTEPERGHKTGVGGGPGDVARLPRPRRSGTDFRINPDFKVREGSWKNQAKVNLDAIEVVKKLDAEKRLPTPAEQETLAKFTGWGASELANNMFPGMNYGRREIYPEGAREGWKELVGRMVELLTHQEISRASNSTQFAHYTSFPVIRSIWRALEKFGFAGGKILEPGMGVGHFFGLVPENWRKATVYTGIEYDPSTGGIAKYLYPNQNILIDDYTKRKFPNNFFDVAVGNPPFSGTKILVDPDYKKFRFNLHEYFFAKSLDKVRPGGILSFVTSRYLMDKGEDKARQYLMDKADLLGAIRLPQTAFKENAGTEVVTDVVFFRKKVPGVESVGQNWMGQKEVETKEGKFLINEYFADHPEMVLGTHSGQGKMYKENEYTVLPEKGDIEEQFAKAVENLPDNIYSVTKQTPEAVKQAVVERDFNPLNRKEGGLYVSDKGVVMRVEDGSGVPLESIKKLTDDDKRWLTDYVPLRDAVKQSHYDQLMEGPWEESLGKLQKLYKDFVKKHGRVNAYNVHGTTEEDEDGNLVKVDRRRYKYGSLLRADIEFPIVTALETITESGDVIDGPALLGRTLKKPEPPTIKTSSDALAVSLDALGKLDLDDVAKLAGRTRDEAIDQLGTLIFKDPSKDDYVLSDEYLSGDVVKKLEEARVAAEVDPSYRRNIEALTKVQPLPLAPTQITAKLGAPWVPPEIVTEFTHEVLGLPPSTEVKYNPVTNIWSLGERAEEEPSYYRRRRGKRQSLRPHGMRGAASEWSMADRGANEILLSVLNSQTIRITKTDPIDKKTYLDVPATARANEIAKNMDKRFKAWIWEDADRTKELVDLYNTQKNNIAKRRFDGSHLTLPGVSLAWKWHPHQKDTVWRIIQTGNTYMAQSMGSGKTATYIAAGMEMKRLGLVQKPMYIVPKSVLQQFATEFQELYPLANVMVADEENFHTDNRRRFVAQATLNAPDAIILTHPAFGLLRVKEENIAPVRKAIIDELTAALEEMRDEGESRIKIKQMEKRIDNLIQRFDSMVEKGDNVVTFEDMGVDFLFVDEAHMFRKLDFSTNRQAKGIDPVGSRRSLDLYIKTKWLDKMKPGRSHVFGSGTPVTNTIGELYTVWRYFNEPQMEADGVRHFDGWAATFGEMDTKAEPNAAGRYEMVTRFSDFVNVNELMTRVKEFMEVLTASQMRGVFAQTGRPIPEILGDKPDVAITPPSSELKAYQREVLQPRIETSRAWKPTPTEPGNPDPLINIITDGRLASIDMRFHGKYENNPGSKLNQWIDGMIQGYKDTAKNTYLDENGQPSQVKGGAIIAFYNHGFGEQAAGRRGFDARAWVMKRFKEAKIPSSEVAWFMDYTDSNKADAKMAVLKEVRNGTKRILIGSAKTMGVGLNVQRRLAQSHYLDPPWYPADVEQPDGRILRQGNQNTKVVVKRYATKGSYDATQWGMVARKSGAIEKAFTGENVRRLEDISETSQYEMAAALASGDERAIRLAGLRTDIENLRNLQAAHYTEQRNLQYQKSDYETRARYDKGWLKDLKNAEKLVPEYVTTIRGKVGSKEYDSKKEFGDALRQVFRKNLPPEVGWEPVEGVAIENKEYDLLLHKDKSKWVVSEGKSGWMIAKEDNKKDAINSANEIISDPIQKKRLDDIIKSNPQSPRYSGTEEDKKKFFISFNGEKALPTVKLGEVSGEKGNGIPIYIEPIGLQIRFTPEVRYTIEEGRLWAFNEDFSGQGLTQKLVNKLNGFDSEISGVERRIKEYEEDLKKIEGKLGTPYTHEQELNEKMAEETQLTQELTAEEVDETEAGLIERLQREYGGTITKDPSLGYISTRDEGQVVKIPREEVAGYRQQVRQRLDAEKAREIEEQKTVTEAREKVEAEKATEEQGKKFYISRGKKGELGEWEEVKGSPVTIEGYEGYDFFVYKDEDGRWVVTEGKTGLAAVRSDLTKVDAITKAKELLDDNGGKENLDKLIKESLEKMGETSPRHGRQRVEKKPSILKDETGAIALDLLVPGFKAVAKATEDLLEAYKRPTEWTDSKQIIGQYTGAMQIIDFKLTKFAKEINSRMPKDLQEAITNYMQAGGDEDLLRERADTAKPPYKKGYEDALNLTPGQKQWADAFRKRSDSVWETAHKAGVIDDYVENYVRGEWENPGKAGKKIFSQVNAGVFQTKPREAKHKIFRDYWEGEQAGYVPKDKRIGYQLVAGERSIMQAIEARKALKALMKSTEKDGRPTVVVGGSGSHVTNPEETGNEAYYVRPNSRKHETNDYKYLDHPAMRRWKWIDQDTEGKPILMQGNMWIHPDAYGRLNALLGKSKIQTYTVPEKIPILGGKQPGRMALTAGGFVKGTILLGPFHQFHVAEHAVFHRVNPFGLPEIDFSKRPLLKDGVEHGLMLFNHRAVYEFGEGLASGGLFHRIPGVGHLLRWYQDWLFSQYIPELKAAMFEHAVKRAEKYYEKQIASGKFTRDQLLDNAAKQANAAFGEQNYKYIGRNPTLQDALRIMLLAPDFLEARLKFAGQALRPHGREQVTALLLGAIIMATTAQIINTLLGDEKKPHWNRPFSIIIGKREYTPRSVVGDIMHLINDPRSFWYHRLNPLWGRPLVEMATGRDFYGRKVGAEKLAEDVLRSWVPIPGQGIIKEERGETIFESIRDSVLSSIGLSNYDYRSDFVKYAEELDRPAYTSTESSRLKRQLVARLRRKDPHVEQEIKNARAEKKLTLTEVLGVRQEAREDPVVKIAKGLRLEELAGGIKHATNDEKKIIGPIFRQKFYNKLFDLSSEEKDRYRKLLKDLPGRPEMVTYPNFISPPGMGPPRAP